MDDFKKHILNSTFKDRPEEISYSKVSSYLDDTTSTEEDGRVLLELADKASLTTEQEADVFGAIFDTLLKTL